jgi:tripartite-type tricarboxylate transporter receptor subunit TctC
VDNFGEGLIMKIGSIVCLAFLALCFGPYPAVAAESDFPSRSVEVTVGYPPGGWTDLGPRMIAERAKKDIGHEIIVINKPGGAARVAMNLS